MKELVVISGKGGTGKTSVTAALSVLADQPVLADCDVDAADLHLVLAPDVKEQHPFRSGHEAVIRAADCSGCGICQENCRFAAIQKSTSGNNFVIDSIACEACGLCVRLCPEQAIDFPERLCGEWMLSETRIGPMVHARLGVAAENSGKLVSTVREEARKVAEAEQRSLVIVDGPPGIGCPVIASLTGTTLVLAVTEPTLSGEHDLDRVLSLARHFEIPVAVCVNKWDLNPEMTERIEALAEQAGAQVVGRIRYDRAVTLAQLQQKAVVEIEAACGEDIRNIWKNLEPQLAGLQ